MLKIYDEVMKYKFLNNYFIYKVLTKPKKFIRKMHLTLKRKLFKAIKNL